MTTGTKIALGVFIGFALLCCGGGGVLVMSGIKGYQAVSTETVKVGDTVVMSVCDDWKVDDLLLFGAPELTATPPAELKAMLDVWKSEYGAYRAGHGVVTGVSSHTDTVSGPVSKAEYRNEAQFEKGPGTVLIQLVKRGSDTWRVASLKIVKP